MPSSAHFRLTLFALTLPAAQAQWTIQQSHATADLRGIHSIGHGVVWASGTKGTVLRTTDDGQTWQPCAVPTGAENLDFRGVQAFDSTTAIVMSSGPGDQSRVYKTSDACRTWNVVFTNPDKEGFWDAIQFSSPRDGILIGDQVRGNIQVFTTSDGGKNWHAFDGKGIAAAGAQQSMFAASNSALLIEAGQKKFYIITGGGITSFIQAGGGSPISVTRPPIATGESAGGFSLAAARQGSKLIIVAVGGDYKSPDAAAGTAATWIDHHWRASDQPPHGYRSAVAYDAPNKTWIAVGPNGTDVSRDEGRTWKPFKPRSGEPPDADRNWNALSLPFVAGPGGRIGKLDSDRLRPQTIN